MTTQHRGILAGGTGLAWRKRRQGRQGSGSLGTTSRFWPPADRKTSSALGLASGLRHPDGDPNEYFPGCWPNRGGRSIWKFLCPRLRHNQNSPTCASISTGTRSMECRDGPRMPLGSVLLDRKSARQHPRRPDLIADMTQHLRTQKNVVPP